MLKLKLILGGIKNNLNSPILLVLAVSTIIGASAAGFAAYIQPSVDTVNAPEITAVADTPQKTVTVKEPEKKSSDKPQTSKPAPTTSVAQPTVADVFADLNSFGSGYGVQFVNKSLYESSKYSWNKVPSTDVTRLKQYASMFKYEFSKYPKSWVKKLGLKKIYIATKVTNVYKVAAIPRSPSEMIYSIEYGTDDYARGVVHHEFHHFVDYYRFGSYYPNDTTWNNLNDTGFTYGSGGFSAYEDGWDNSEHPEEGFVTGYAMTGSEEDRAEVFAYIMVDSRNTRLYRWAKTDDILLDKIKYMKNKLTNENSGFSAYF
jgi:hypothetical protein